MTACPKSEAAIQFLKKRNTSVQLFKPLKPDYETDLMQLSLAHSLLNYNLPNFCQFDIPENYAPLFDTKVQVTYDKSITIFFSTIDQRNDLWKEERKLRTTGSICYELFINSVNQYSDWKKN